MTDTGLKWLSFFIGSGVLIYIIRLIFFGGKYCKTIDRLEIDNNSINSKLDTLINSFNRLIGKLEKIKELKGLDDIFLRTTSPKTLTEAGIKMLQESGLKNFIEQNKDELIKAVKSHDPQTNYDIEQHSVNTMMLLSNDMRINNIKHYAFKNGQDLNLMLIAAGIYLRDLIIQNQKEE